MISHVLDQIPPHVASMVGLMTNGFNYSTIALIKPCSFFKSDLKPPRGFLWMELFDNQDAAPIESCVNGCSLRKTGKGCKRSLTLARLTGFTIWHVILCS